MSSLISALNMTKRYGARTVVDALSLEVARGEVLGLLGPNGAGKSTTMKMLTGFIESEGGEIRMGGHDVNLAPLDAKTCFGYLPEGAPAYSDMTVSGYLGFIADARGVAVKSKAIDNVINAVNIDEVMGQKIETLSKGFARRVGLAQAMLHDPDILILDEPTDGLDPNQKQEVRQLILSMAPHKAIIISTHILEEVTALCSRAIIIDHGRIVADGTPKELVALSPLHGNVVLRVEDQYTQELTPALNSLSEVTRLTTRACPAAIGTTEFILAGSSCEKVLKAVRERLAEGNWPTEDLRVAQGQLDDVFRTLTQGDRSTSRESSRQSEVA